MTTPTAPLTPTKGDHYWMTPTRNNSVCAIRHRLRSVTESPIRSDEDLAGFLCEQIVSLTAERDALAKRVGEMRSILRNLYVGSGRVAIDCTAEEIAFLEALATQPRPRAEGEK